MDEAFRCFIELNVTCYHKQCQQLIVVCHDCRDWSTKYLSPLNRNFEIYNYLSTTDQIFVVDKIKTNNPTSDVFVFVFPWQDLHILFFKSTKRSREKFYFVFLMSFVNVWILNSSRQFALLFFLVKKRIRM